MPTYHFTAEVTVNATTTVEADSEEQAREIAEGRTVRLAHGPADCDDEDSWLVTDADGDAQEIRLDRADEADDPEDDGDDDADDADE